jgi:hypothetical protein
MIFVRIVGVFLSVISFFTQYTDLYSQSEVHDHDLIGCRMVKSKIAGIRWSPAELAYAKAIKERSDTFDILHYKIDLEVYNFSQRRIDGSCDVTFVHLLDSTDYINLDLEGLQVSNVFLGEDTLLYLHEGSLLTCFLPRKYQKSDTLTVTVFYGGTPITSPSGFGGFYFENGYAYNLGIGITDQPHNFGRAWYPCFDNFVERSTYEYVITHQPNHQAHCVGTFMGTEDLPSGYKKTRYIMSQEIPTYLSSIAVSDYIFEDKLHEGIYGEVPIRLIARPQDMNDMRASFVNLGLAIDAFEHWFGPHVWERVGYVLTTRGAMEHPTNVAYPQFTVVGGNRNERLMAHELAHMWWGNITTLSTSQDMWIKEGNAEYGAHLFTEYAYGYDEFITQVKDNALRVLRTAHVDDGEFLALSPMPADKTYSVQTYNKGAMMIHNLRGYLGDIKFSEGMTALLNNNEYSAINAMQFRDQLSQFADYDLTDYFEDWIFRPGYPTFEVDSFLYTVDGTHYRTTLHIEQKLRAREKYFTNIPLEISIYDRDLNRFNLDTLFSGQYTTLEVDVPIEPWLVLINESDNLNLGFQSNQRSISTTGNYQFPHALMTLSVSSLPNEGWLHIEHHWTAPDGFKSEQPNARLSQNRHWKVFGSLPEGTGHFAVITYNGIQAMDDDLVSMTEDSLILVWRPDASGEWIEHPNYRKFMLFPNDGNGTIRIFDLFPGEYALANGSLNVVSSVRSELVRDLHIFPNPVSDRVIIQIPETTGTSILSLSDLQGRILHQQKFNSPPLVGEFNWDLPKTKPGHYIVSFEDQQRKIIYSGMIQKIN